MCRFWLAAAVAALLVSSPLAAQDAGSGGFRAPNGALPPLSTWAIELTVGPTHTRGSGDYVEANESALWGDVLVAVRLRPVGGGFLLVAGAAATRITPRAVEGICRIDPRGDCAPHFPVFRIAGAGVGWENARATKRLLLLPALVDSDVAEPSLGWQVRFDLAGALTQRIALVVGTRATLVPHHRGDRFGIFGAAAGLRLR
jgi:hypothetical protein